MSEVAEIPLAERETNKPVKMTTDKFFGNDGLGRLAEILGSGAQRAGDKVTYGTNYIEAREGAEGYWFARVGRTKLAHGKPSLLIGSRMVIEDGDVVKFVDPPPKGRENDDGGFLLSYIEVSADGIVQKQVLTGPLNKERTEEEKLLLEAALESKALRDQRAKEFVNKHTQ